MDMDRSPMEETRCEIYRPSALRTVRGLKRCEQDDDGLLDVTQYMEYALKILKAMIHVDNISLDIVDSHLDYLIQIAVLSRRFDWQKVLDYDHDYRNAQYQSGFKWGSEKYSLKVKNLFGGGNPSNGSEYNVQNADKDTAKEDVDTACDNDSLMDNIANIKVEKPDDPETVDSNYEGTFPVDETPDNFKQSSLPESLERDTLEDPDYDIENDELDNEEEMQNDISSDYNPSEDDMSENSEEVGGEHSPDPNESEKKSKKSKSGDEPYGWNGKRKARHLCKECGAAFIQKRWLESHMLIHKNNGEYKFKCAECGKCFMLKNKFTKHMKYHGEKTEACETCKKKFYTREDLREHERTHFGEARFRPHQCVICDKSFLRRHHLRDHMRIHTDDKPFGCDICGRRFMHRAARDGHVRLHNGETIYGCTLCERSYCTAAALSIHMKTHSDERPFICHICSKSYKHSAHLKEHIQTHSEEKPFACPMCDKSFKTKGSLQRHEKGVHNSTKEEMCEVCGNNFATKVALAVHMRTHTGETPYQCDVCHKAFNQSSSLQRHRLIHSGEKPHRCKVCSEAFRDRSTLSKHMFTHTREKPHACHLCSKSFPWSHLLKKHIENKHGVPAFGGKASGTPTSTAS